MPRASASSPDLRWSKGLSLEEAARYVGVGRTLFLEMVEDGRMPKPKRANSRVIWDRDALDSHFADLPDAGGTDADNRWLDVAP